MNSLRTKLLIIIAILALGTHSYAATYTSAVSGNWSSPSTWLGGVVPPINLSNKDVITISASDTVIMTYDLTIGYQTSGGDGTVLDVYGTLSDGGVPHTLNLGVKAKVNLYSGGSIEISTINLETSKQTPVLTIASGGSVTVDTLTNVNGSIINGGVITAEIITNDGSITNTGEIITGSYTGTPPTGGGTLPISLLSFKAWVNQRKLVEAEWISAMEDNNDFFTLEKSTDMLEWSSAGIVLGAGNSNTLLSYSLIDKNPFGGLSYYRLKQTDYDGKFTYGSVVPVQVKKQDFVRQVYAAQEGQLYFQTETIEGEFLVEVLDLSGRTVHAHSLHIEGEGLQTLYVPALAKSVYLLRVSSQQTGISQTLKFSL